MELTNTQKKIMANLKELNGQAIVSFNAKTQIKLLGGKKNPMLNRVEKVMKNGQIMIMCNMNSNGYDNMVKRRLKAEGKDPESFKLSKRVWGERVPNTPFVLHKGQVYVEAIFLKAPKNVSYLLDGKPIDKDLIEGLKDKPKEGKQGGLDNKVAIRTYKLESLTGLKWGALSVS